MTPPVTGDGGGCPQGAAPAAGPGSAPLLLASGSPRRRELLAALAVPFEVAAGAAFQEWAERENRALSPSEFVWRNALGKGLAAARRFPGRTVLAADTIVSLGARIFGKPRDRAEAAATLSLLGGRTHLVQTAVVLISPAGRGRREGGVHGGIERTRVTFRPLPPAAIGRYLAAVEVADKAGSYAIQQHGDWLAARIEGSFSNVIGLPLERVAALLAGRQSGRQSGRE